LPSRSPRLVLRIRIIAPCVSTTDISIRVPYPIFVEVAEVEECLATVPTHIGPASGVPMEAIVDAVLDHSIQFG
jgi:hypothetical protein